MKLFEIFGEFNLNSQEAIKEIDSVDKKAGGFGKKIGELGAGVAKFGMVAGAAIAGVAIAIVGSTAQLQTEFTKASNGMAAATGKTKEEMEELNKSMKNVYANNFGDNFEDIANTMTKVSNLTGMVGEELEKVTESAFLMRDTFEWDVDAQISTVNSLMKNFGVTSEEAFNMLATGAQNGLDKNGDLLEMVDEYGVHFKDLGLSSEEMFAMLQKGAEGGVFQIEKMGDAMKEFGIRTKDNSKATLEAYEALGLNGEQITKDFANGGESAKKATQKVMTELGKMTDKVKQTEIGVALFGTMWEDLGADAVLSMSNIDTAVYNTSNALEEMNKIKYDDFGSAMEGIKRQVQVGLLDTIGEKLVPIMSEFSNWLQSNMPLILATIESVVGGLSGMVTWLIDAFMMMKTTASDSFDFTPLLENIKMFAEIGKQILDGIIQFFVEFYKNNEEEIGAFIESFKVMIESVVGAIKAFTDMVLKFWNEWGDEIMATLSIIITTLINMFTNVFTVIKNIYDAFASAFKGDWKGFLDNILLAFDNTIKGIIAFFEGLLPAFKNVVLLVIVAILEFLASIAKSVDDEFKKIGENIKNAVQGMKDKIVSIWSGLTDTLTAPFKAVGGALDKAKEGIAGLGEKIADGAKKLVGNAEGTAYSTANTRTLVGEKGPEIVELPTGSKVIPNSKAFGTQTSGTSGDTNIENKFEINGLVVREEADIDKIAKKLYTLQQQKNRSAGLKPVTA